MKINQTTVAHLAELSSFALNDAESDTLQKNLTDILGYIFQLDELDTTGVEPTYQVFEMQNVWRADEIQAQEASPEQLLALAPAVDKGQIKVPKVL